MPHPTCTAGLLWVNPNEIRAGGETINREYLPVNQSRNAFMQVSSIVQPLNTDPTVATYEVNFYICSGRAPGTRELLLARFAGVMTTAQQTIRSFDAFQQLPIAKRPFDPALDCFQLQATPWKPVNDNGQQWNVNIQVCNTTTGSTDCCAELTAKLDLVLAHVAHTYVNQP